MADPAFTQPTVPLTAHRLAYSWSELDNMFRVMIGLRDGTLERRRLRMLVDLTGNRIIDEERGTVIQASIPAGFTTARTAFESDIDTRIANAAAAGKFEI